MSFSLGYYPFPKKPLFCRACVPWPTKGGGSLAAMGRGGRTHVEREKEPKTAAATTEDPKKSRFFAFFFPLLNGAAHPSSASHFPSSFSLGGFVFVSRSNPRESRSREGGKGKSAYLLGLAPKAMSESCGIFFFRRRHFSFAVKEEGKKDTLSSLFPPSSSSPSFSLGFRGGLRRWRRRRTPEDNGVSLSPCIQHTVHR